jgi:hypothetical protein
MDGKRVFLFNKKVLCDASIEPQKIVLQPENVLVTNYVDGLNYVYTVYILFVLFL